MHAPRLCGLLASALAVFRLDARSLAVFRIGLALTILLDLAIRAQDLGAHYTDAGVVPRALLATQVGERISWAPALLYLNPHFLFGGLAGQAALFLAAGVFALLLLVGWRTPWVTVASWVLLASLHGRNPGVMNTGDVVLRLMLFWAMFLPLGACWSIDAARRAQTGCRHTVVAGGAAAALLLQIAFIYVFNVQFKTGAAWRTDFTALERALAGETWIAPWGEWLLHFPELLGLMTRLVIMLEMFGPLLLFLPIRSGPARTLAVILFSGFHLGILLGMRIGIFPIACIVAWLAVLPTWFWQKLGTAGDRVAVPRRLPRWQSAAALAIVGYVFAWNVVTVRTGTEPGGLFGAPGYMLRIDQRWSMFSPEPSLRTRFLIARGETVAGKTVDLLSEGPADGIERASGRYDRVRWRQYFGYTIFEARRDVRERLAAYLAQRWDSLHSGGQRLTAVDLSYVDKAILTPHGNAHPVDRDRGVRRLASLRSGE